MDAQELAEIAHQAHRREERRIGMTMAVFAALLAVTTMLGHRAHTEEVVLQTQAADAWAFYQAKNGRAHMYDANAQLAELSGPPGVTLAMTFIARADTERKDAAGIQRTAEGREEETRTAARRALFYDASEIFLEVAIVLCSIALLADALFFWKVSFASAVAGCLIALYGWLGRSS
jgi:hypothetical protein